MKIDNLSETQKKEFGKRMRELRARYKNRKRKERKLINPVTTPQYDDTCYEIITWLDSLAGEPFSEGEYIVEFSGEAWNSASRKGQDLS